MVSAPNDIMQISREIATLRYHPIGQRGTKEDNISNQDRYVLLCIHNRLIIKLICIVSYDISDDICGDVQWRILKLLEPNIAITLDEM